MKMQFRYLFLTTVVFAFFCMVLGPISHAQGQKFQGVTLNVMVHAGHKQFEPVWARLAEFEKKTGMKVNLIRAPWGDIFPKVMRDLTMGGRMYDVIEVSEAMTFTVAPYMAPVEDLLAEEGENVAEWKSQWFPFALEYATYNGKVTFHPFYSGMQIGFYRKALFEDPKEKANFKKRYGYELAPPKTIDQLRDIAEFFTRDLNGDGKTDLYGLIIPGKWDTGENLFEDHLFRAGLQFFDDNLHCSWGPGHPENQKIVEEIAEFDQRLLREWKVVPPEVIGMEDTEAIQLYLDGKGAMIMTFLYFGWKDANRPEVVKRIGPTGTFVIPSRKPGAGGFAGAWYRGINKNSPRREQLAALEFIKWACSEENLILALKEGQGSYIPAHVKAAQRGAAEGLIPPANVEAAKTGRTVQGVPVLEACRDVLRELHEKLLMGSISPREFTVQSAARIDELLKKAGLVKD